MYGDEYYSICCILLLCNETIVSNRDVTDSLHLDYGSLWAGNRIEISMLREEDSF